VELGAVRPLVSMMASNAEPRHYAGLALLKLADNFENHLRIAEEGGIQALLRLGRTRTTDEQLQYKAALTVGQLASNAVKLLPQGGTVSGVNGGTSNTDIGHGVRMMTKIKSQSAAQKGRKNTLDYMEKSTAENHYPSTTAAGTSAAMGGEGAGEQSMITPAYRPNSSSSPIIEKRIPKKSR